MELGAAIIRLEADASSVMGQIKALRGQVEGETGKVAQGWDKSWSGMGGSASSVLRGIAGVAGVSLGAAGVVGFLKGATSAALEFDLQMDKVASRLSGADFGMLGKLGDDVGDMSVKFGEGTKGLTDGLADIIDAGIPASQAVGVLDNSVLLAKGHMAEVSPVISSVTSILQGFKIAAADSGHVVDVLANTADRGRGPMEGLAGTIGFLSPYAEQAGFSLEETAAAVSTLTRESVPLEKTGMALRMMFGNLSEAMEKGAIKSTTLSGAIAELEGMEEKERNAIVGSDRVRIAYNVLLQQSAGYTEDLALATDRAGTAQEKWARISGDAAQKMDSLKQAAVGFARSVGEGLSVLLDQSGVLDDLKDGFVGLAESIRGTREIGDLGRTISDIGEGAASAVSAFQKSKSEVEGLVGQYNSLSQEISGLDKGSAEYAKKQAALTEVMEKIGRIVPTAITAFGKYGEVLSIDTEIAGDFVASQEKVLAATLRVKEAQAKLVIAEIGTKRNELLREESGLLASVAEKQKIVDDMLARYNDLVVSDAAIKSGYETANENLNEEEAALAKVQVELAQYRQAEEELKAVKDILAQANSGEISSNQELVKRLQDVTSGTDKAAEADKRASDATKDHKDNVEDLTKAVKQASDEWGQYYKDQERLSGWSRDQIIADIEAEIRALEASGKKGSADWEALWSLRKQYTEDAIADEIAAERDAAQRITDIWAGVNEDIKSAMSDSLADMITGDADFEDALKDLGNRIKDSFAQGFADALIEKSGFDLLFKGNMLDLGASVGGLGTSIVSTLGGAFSDVTDWLGITGEATAGLGEGLGEVSIAAGETGAALDYSGAVAQIEAAEAASAELASSTAVAAESWDTMGEVIEEGTGAALEQTTALTESSKGLFSTWSAGIATVGGLATGLVATYVGASKMSDALKGGDGAARQFAAGLGNIVAPATMALSILGETGDVISGITAGAVIGTQILPGLGTVLGGLAGAAASFAEGLGIGGSHVTFEEEFNKYIQDFAEGTKTEEELFQQVYLRMANYANDFWGTQDELLNQSLEDRQAYYDKFAALTDAQGNSLFSEDQLSKMRDALQLSEDEAEKAAMAIRTSFENAGLSINATFYDAFGGSEMMDALDGWKEKWEEAVAEVQESGGDVWAIFEDKLRELPGMTDETMSRIKETLEGLKGEVDLSIDTVSGKETGGGKGGKESKVKYGGLLVPEGEMLAEVMRDQVIPGLASFVSELTTSGQGFANLSEQQASSVLNLIGAEDTLANRQSLMGQTAEGTSSALNNLIAATYGTAEGTGALGSEYDNLVGKIGGFAWGDWMLPLNWQEYIKEVNLSNFVEGVDLREFASSASSSKQMRGSLRGEGRESISVVIESGAIRIGQVRTDADMDEIGDKIAEQIVRANKLALKRVG